PHGAEGALVYTGHFWPLRKNGGRRPVRFYFHALDDNRVSVFGERSKSLTEWQSPYNHPAFVYFGPVEPLETSTMIAVVDPRTPDWAVAELQDLLPKALSSLEEEFGFGLSTKLNIFLSTNVNGEKGRLKYGGDALPGQIQVTLTGASWEKKTAQTLDILRSATVHELTHLWQVGARPRTSAVAPWIHEGAADAMAADIMMSLGYWPPQLAAARLRRSRETCERGLEFGSLAGAHARKDYRTAYACGHVIASAVAKAEGRSTASFWREFVETAARNNGYTEETFFELVRERTSDAGFARALRHFERTPLAEPDKEIDQLLTAAESVNGAAPLAPSEGR
ncbi:MAG: hypothetical protein ACX939_11570, partial [Hyphococcus sp.]